VFFRAKEWEDAIKVLSSMFSLSNMVLPKALEGRLGFLIDFGISFGGFVINIGADFYIPVWIFFGFIFILFFRNSIQLLNHFKISSGYLIYTIIILITALGGLNEFSEFLYFNF
jgi:hypothetical protein